MNWWPFKRKLAWQEHKPIVQDRHVLLLFPNHEHAMKSFRAACVVAHPEAKIIRSMGVIKQKGLRVEFSVHERVERYKGRYWDVVIPMVEQKPEMYDHLRWLLF